VKRKVGAVAKDRVHASLTADDFKVIGMTPQQAATGAGDSAVDFVRGRLIEAFDGHGSPQDVALMADAHALAFAARLTERVVETLVAGDVWDGRNAWTPF
jgi:hypothetical protein